MRTGLVIGIAAALAGCAGLPPVVKLGSLALSGMSYLVTGKGPSDHVISAVADRDCALLRVVRDQPVCLPPAAPVVTRPQRVAARTPVRSIPANAGHPATPMSPADRPIRHRIDAPAIYLVVGSFAQRSRAARWQASLHPLSTRIIASIGGARQGNYRVITGPVPATQSLSRQAALRQIGIDAWRVSLCKRSLRPPPCPTRTLVADR